MLNRILLGPNNETLMMKVEDFLIGEKVNHQGCTLNWLYDIKPDPKCPVTFDIEKHISIRPGAEGEYWAFLVKGLSFNKEEAYYQVGSIIKDVLQTEDKDGKIKEDVIFRLSLLVGVEEPETFTNLDKAISRMLVLGVEKVQKITGFVW